VTVSADADALHEIAAALHEIRPRLSGRRRRKSPNAKHDAGIPSPKFLDQDCRQKLALSLGLPSAMGHRRIIFSERPTIWR